MIIGTSCCPQGYTSPSLATFPYCSSPLAGLQGYIPYPHSCCMYVRAGRHAFARLYVGVHRSTSLTSSSMLFQQCPACLVRLTCIVFVMRGRWPYSWYFVGVAPRTCSILLAAFLCNCRLAFLQLFS